MCADVKGLALVALGCALVAQPAGAQTTVNPDISAIPRFLLRTDDGARLNEGIRRLSQPDFSFQELEITIQSYLNPFAKADVVMTVPGPDIESARLGIEELYASVVRGLPLDLNIRFGKYRAEFGKLNMMHPHAWPFVSQPIVAERFLGEDGLNDLGISASLLLPTGDVYSRFTIDLLRGNAIAGGAGMPDTSGRRPFYATSARLMGFFSLNDESDLEAGISGYTGIHDPYARHRFWYCDVDVKYKYRANAYTSLTVQGEALLNSRRVGPAEGRRVTSAGMYLFTEYQFLKRYTAGARFDWSQAPYSVDDRGHGISLFGGFYPVEETLGLRLEYQLTTIQSTGVSRTVNAIMLQALFSLGPHKAHPF